MEFSVCVCSFVLSLGDCNSCLVLDDELNVLPLSKAARGLTALPGTSHNHLPQVFG